MSYTIKGVVYFHYDNVPAAYYSDNKVICECCGLPWVNHSGTNCRAGLCGKAKPRPKITTKPFVLK